MEPLEDIEGSRWVTLARLLRPQGRRGEVLADLLTDFPETLTGRQHLYLAPAASDHMDAKWKSCTVLESWLPKGKNEGRAVLRFEGVNDISAAELLAGWELRTTHEQRQALSPEEAYIDDLLGCDVLDHGHTIGTVTDVQFPTTADGKRRLEDAPVLLIVESAGTEFMIPFVSAYLERFDAPARQIIMQLPAGLIEAQLPVKSTAPKHLEPTGEAD